MTKNFEINIRHALESDVQQLCCLRNSPVLYQQYLQDCDGQSAHFLVAEIDNIIAGFGLVYLDVTKTGKRKSLLPKLSDLYVAESHRGLGVG